MRRMARAPERNAISEIRELLAQHSPSSYCDACLTLWLEISLAAAKAAAVSGEPVFSCESRDPYACGRIIEATSMSPPKRPVVCSSHPRARLALACYRRPMRRRMLRRQGPTEANNVDKTLSRTNIGRKYGRAGRHESRGSATKFPPEFRSSHIPPRNSKSGSAPPRECRLDLANASRQYHWKIIEQRGGGLIEFRGGAAKLRFGRRNFVAKLPRNSAPGYGSASVFTGRSPIFARIWRACDGK
jgi:hypothetical protein